MSHTSYSLELTPETFFPDLFGREPLELHCLSSNAAEFARFLWQKVGEGFWTERDEWHLQNWRLRIGDASVAFFAAYSQGEPVGCFELGKVDGQVKIEGFGLLEPYRGDGFGHTLLTLAAERAFSMGASRVWLETATDDHPAALPLYKSQGFKVFKEEPLVDRFANSDESTT